MAGSNKKTLPVLWYPQHTCARSWALVARSPIKIIVDSNWPHLLTYTRFQNKPKGISIFTLKTIEILLSHIYTMY